MRKKVTRVPLTLPFHYASQLEVHLARFLQLSGIQTEIVAPHAFLFVIHVGLQDVPERKRFSERVHQILATRQARITVFLFIWIKQRAKFAKIRAEE